MTQHKKQTIKKKRKAVNREIKDIVAVFIDYHNITIGLRNQNMEIDLIDLNNYLAEGRKLIGTFIYFGINPNDPESNRDLIERLNKAGFLIRQKIAKVLPNGSLKCNCDVEMVLDILEFVEKTKPNIVVLVTGDGDFIPLVQKLRMQGIRVEIASFDGVLSKELKNTASGFIDLFST